MKAVKVLHMADMHLEWPFVGLGGDSTRGRLRREELKAVFAAIIELAIAEQVELFLIAGDLFEHAHVTRGTIRFLDQQFKRLGARTRVFISPGNHDPILPASYYRSHPWPGNVHIFGPDPERVDLDDLGVTLWGFGFGAFEVTDYQFAGVRVADPDRINIALFHGGDERYHPFRPADLAALGADYIALGHIHKPGPVLQEGGRVVARYAGSPEALSFGEPGEHGVWVGSVSRQSTDLRFVPTGRRAYYTQQVDVSQALTTDDLTAALLAVDGPEERQTHCYRIALTGSPDPSLVLDLPVLQERLAPHFFHLRLLDQTRPDYDLSVLARERSARGLFVQHLQALAAATTDPAEQDRISRALAIGLAAFAEGGSGR